MTGASPFHQRLKVDRADQSIIPSHRVMGTGGRAEIKGHMTPEGRESHNTEHFVFLLSPFAPSHCISAQE